MRIRTWWVLFAIAFVLYATFGFQMLVECSKYEPLSVCLFVKS